MSSEQNVETVKSRICYLLDIPPELRNAFYELTLPKYDHIKVKGKYVLVNGRNRRVFNCYSPPLTATCSMIRSEALPMFRSLNTLRFSTSYVRYAHLHPAVLLGNLQHYVHCIKTFEVKAVSQGCKGVFVINRRRRAVSPLHYYGIGADLTLDMTHAHHLARNRLNESISKRGSRAPFTEEEIIRLLRLFL